MSAIKSQHSNVLERLIKAQQADLLTSLGVGGPQDYAAYKQIVGRIEGLGDALRISEMADYEISGDVPDASP